MKRTVQLSLALPRGASMFDRQVLFGVCAGLNAIQIGEILGARYSEVVRATVDLAEYFDARCLEVLAARANGALSDAEKTMIIAASRRGTRATRVRSVA